MKQRCRSRPARRGTTLIEVLVGLVILSTLLVSVAIARGRFMRQWGDADRKLRLVHAADTLMTQWTAGPPQAVPTHGRGTLDGGVVWRTREIPDRGAAGVGAVVVRLDLSDAAAGQAAGVSIDFMLRDPRRPAEAADVH